MTTIAAGSAPIQPSDERVVSTSLLRKLMIRPEFGALVGAIVVWLVFMLAARGTWLSWLGTANYVDVSTLYGLTALAVALLMIGGEFDLSAGVMTGVSGMFTGLFAVHAGLHVVPALLVSLALCLVIGFLNGYMVIKSALPSFIVTLGTFFALRGFNLWITQRVAKATNVTGITEEPGYELGRKLFSADMFHIGRAAFSVRILWFLGMAAVGAWVLMRTRIGNWIFAVGGNKEAARMVGVPAAATKVGLFMTVAFCGWVRGAVVLFETNRSNVIEGVGREFYFIIAAVLGGCLLTGGFGSIIGAALGCFILGMTEQGIPLAGWDNNLYFLFLGVILLIAAFSNEWIRRRARAASKPSPAMVRPATSSAAGGADAAGSTAGGSQ